MAKKERGGTKDKNKLTVIGVWGWEQGLLYCWRGRRDHHKDARPCSGQNGLGKESCEDLADSCVVPRL
jgi:hypothetical protein